MKMFSQAKIKKSRRENLKKYWKKKNFSEKNEPDSSDCFGLVSLFNGISTFVGYLMLKLFSLKNSSDTI